MITQDRRNIITIESFLAQNGITINGHTVNDLPEWFVEPLAKALTEAKNGESKRATEMANRRFQSLVHNLTEPMWSLRNQLIPLLDKIEEKKQ